jgi:hypothetical protein
VTALLITLLLINAVFNIVVWPRFYGRIAKDPRARDENGAPTRFLVVHAVLIGIALLLAVVSVAGAVVAMFSGA